ncbi:hypothetical protein RA27_17535 [Ruegeria sp. ANG-R]|nr:hypothetical protein RA27_17535 [Ruegeria sp. ANG-R]
MGQIEFPFTSPDELGQYLPYLFTRLSNRWSADQNTALAENGLHGAKLRVLSSLSAFGELTINQLSILSVTEQSTTSRTVEQLVVAGLVERNILSTDQRIRTVNLTPTGKAALKELSPKVNELYLNMVKGVSRDDLDTCVRVLGTLLQNVKNNQI